MVDRTLQREVHHFLTVGPVRLLELRNIHGLMAWHHVTRELVGKLGIIV